MNSPFRPKKISVPGILSDDALQEQLKQFANQKNALQDAAPPPTSAVDFADKIKSEYLDKPSLVIGASPAMRAAQPAPAASAVEADRQKQDSAIDFRSSILSEGAAAIKDPNLRNLLLGPAIGLVGEGSPLSTLGTLDSPEARQAEAEKQAIDAAKAEAAAKVDAQVREDMSTIIDGDQTPGGIRATLMGEPDPIGPIIAEQNKTSIAEASAKRKEKVEALTDPTKQPTQKWWLDAIQAGVRSAYEIPVSGLKAPLSAWEGIRDAVSLGKDEKSQGRAIVDTLDAAFTKMLPGDKTRSKDMAHELASAGGSLLGFWMAGWAARAAGLPAEVGTMYFGASSQGQQQYEEAEQFGAVGLTKYMALILGSTIGLSEAIPINTMFFRMDAATGGAVRRMFTRTTASFIEEAVQEAGQQFGSDVVAKYLYDAKREFDVDKYLKAGLIGGLTGGLAGAAASVLHESGVTGEMSPPDYVAVTPQQREATAEQTIQALDQEFEALPGLAEAVGQKEAERVLGDFTLVNPTDVNLAPFPTSEKFTVVDPADDATNTPPGEFDGVEVTAAADQENVPAGMRRVIAPGGVEKIIGEALLKPVANDNALAPAADIAANIQPTNDAKPVQPVVEGPGGTIPVNDAGKFEITHGSRLVLEVIDPAKRGTGPLKGEERKRLGTPGNGDPNVVDRSYYGVGDPDFGAKFAAANALLPPRQKVMRQRTDPYFGENLEPFRHTVEVDPATIYNWDQDPLNLKSKLDRTLAASEQVTQYEKLIYDAGFKGAYRSSTGLGQVAMLFEPATPTRVVHTRYGLPPNEVATPEDFSKPTAETFSEKGGWAVITATQEAVGPASDPENIAANEKLRKELKRNGIKYQEVGGSYQGVDQGKSFLVFMPEADAVKLGKKYKQESVLTRKGLEYADGRLVPAVPEQTVVGDAARKNDFVSTLPNGEAFSVGLDFGGELAPGEADLFAQRAPQLVPAVKVGGSVYSGATHLDALQKVPQAQRAAAQLDGNNRGFVNHRGRFLDRFKAQDYAVENDLLNPLLPEWTRTAPELSSEWLAKDGEAGDLFAMRASVVDVGPITGTGANGKVKVIDIGRAMTADHEARMGRQLYPETDEGDYDIVLGLARAELADQLKRANSGVGWYGKDVEEAVTTTARMFPTLLTEPAHRQLYLTYAGIFSNGATPEQAWMMSAEAFRYFLATGRSPVKRVNPDGTPTKTTADGKAAGWSVRTAANEQQLALLNYLVEREGGLEQAMTWLTSLQPRTAINAAMTESGLYKEGRFPTKASQAGETFGFLAFGEKLGRYTLGLHGVPLDAGDTTVDLWYTRSFRRWTGRLMEAPIGYEGIAGGVNSEAERQAIFRLTGDLVKENPGLTAGDVQAVLWFFEKRLWGDHGIRTEEGSSSSGARKLVSSLPNDGGGGAGEGVRTATEADLLANRQDVTQTEAFQKWFGDSKVVDADGKPLVVYHGTPNGEFEAFDPSKAGRRDAGFYGSGIYLTADKAEAESYAEDLDAEIVDGIEPYVVEAYVSIKNPFVWDTSTEEKAAATLSELKSFGVMKNTDVLRYDNNLMSYDVRRFNQEMAKRGHDGVVTIRPVYTEYGEEPVAGFGELVAFSPNQIKSVNNRGTFDPSDDRILFNRGTGNRASFIEAEQVITRYTRGELTPAQARKELAKMGWQVGPEGFKKQNSPIELIDPNGDAEWTYGNRGTGNRAPLKGEQTRPDQGIAPNPAIDPEQVGDITLIKMGRDVVNLLDATARQGRLTIKGAGVLGQYSRKQDVIRVKDMADLPTIVHEGGHALYFDAGPALTTVLTNNEAALMQAATDLYGGDVAKLSKADHKAEGFSEFFRVYTLNRGYAEIHYPQLTADFTRALQAEAPLLLKGLDLVAKKFEAWLQLPSSQLVKNMIVSGKQDSKFAATIKELQEAGFPTWMHEVARKTVETTINRFAPLNDVVAKILNKAEENAGKALDLKMADDPRVLFRRAANSDKLAMIQLTDGLYAYHSTQPSTRSLQEALLRYHGLNANQSLGSIDPTRKQDFAAYLVALRGIDEYRRYAEHKLDRPPFGVRGPKLGDLHQTVKDMEDIYGTDFVRAAEIVNEYGRGMWKKRYDAGRLTKEAYETGLDRSFYAPLQRDMSDKKKALGPSALTSGDVVHRFKGSGRDIIDPMDVLMHMTFALEKNIAANDAKKALASLADRAGKAGALVERVPAQQMIGTQWSVKDVAKQLTKSDDISDTEAQDLMEILGASIENDNVISMFKQEQASTKGENIIFFWEEGRLAALHLVDGDLGRDVVNLVEGIGKENTHFAIDLIAASSSMFRASITSWPDFLAVNFVIDQLSTWVLNDVGYIPFVTGAKGTFDEVRQRQWAKQYNAAMGIMGGMNVATLHDARVNRDIGSLRKQGYFVKAFTQGGAFGPLSSAVKGMASLAELTETGTRVGLYQKSFERAKRDGLNDYEAQVEAGFIATDNMDFGLNGSRMLSARRTIPFLNAALQGYYKLVRTLGANEVRQRKGIMFVLGAYLKSTKNMDLSRTEKMAINTGRKAWVKMMSLGLLSAALHFLYEDDPDYQRAGEYLRTTGWIIPTGDGKVFYIPKPRELAIFANFIERALEASNGDASAKDRFMRGLAMSSLPMSPPLLQLIVENKANYDFFSGREIVPPYLARLKDTPELQYDEYTSDLAKKLGQVLGVSPMRLDHILSGLGASAYRDATTMINSFNSTRPETDATDWIFTRRFFRDTKRGSTIQKDFWDMASTVNGTLTAAAAGYDRLLKGGNTNAADAYLSTLDEDTRAYTILVTDFKPEAKRLNPFYRARQVSSIASAMRREIVSELSLEDTSTKVSENIMLTAREKAQLDEALSDYQQREMRNTLVAMGAPGWANKKMLDVQGTVDLIQAIEPRVADELQRRIVKEKVYSFDTVNTYWPEVKDRLLRDRENTFLQDIVTIAKVMR